MSSHDTWLKDYRAKEAEKAIICAVSGSYKGGRYSIRYEGKDYDCWKLSDVKEEDLKTILEKARQVEAANNNIRREAEAHFNQLKDAWHKLPMPTPDPPNPIYPEKPHPIKEFEKFRLAVIEAKEEVSRLQQEWINDAVAYCIENGKVINKDFTIADAVAVANDVAFELEVARRIQAYKDGTEEINAGCDDCDGSWDGEDNRCCSGGCKMGWHEDSGHTFKTPSVYPGQR